MPEYQITYWRELPSLVVARDEAGADVTKKPLATRLQGAIDEAAMRLGDVGSEDYLAGWRRGEWTATDESPAAAADSVVAQLESEWTPVVVREYLDSLGPVRSAP